MFHTNLLLEKEKKGKKISTSEAKFCSTGWRNLVRQVLNNLKFKIQTLISSLPIKFSHQPNKQFTFLAFSLHFFHSFPNLHPPFFPNPQFETNPKFLETSIETHKTQNTQNFTSNRRPPTAQSSPLHPQPNQPLPDSSSTTAADSAAETAGNSALHSFERTVAG